MGAYRALYILNWVYRCVDCAARARADAGDAGEMRISSQFHRPHPIKKVSTSKKKTPFPNRRYYAEDFVNWPGWLGGLVQCGLYDFFYYYAQSKWYGAGSSCRCIRSAARISPTPVGNGWQRPKLVSGISAASCMGTVAGISNKVDA